MNETPKEAILMLADGTVAKGLALGVIGTTTGEICFNTGMTGYQEIYTDPSYYGQIIINTSAHIGNYGVKLDIEEESGNIQVKGVVCNAYAEHYYSRKTADYSLQSYFEKAGIVGISHVDTRQIVRHVRNMGAMNCIISSEIQDLEELKKRLDETPGMEGLELGTVVSTVESYTLGESGCKKLAVVDYGCKKNILKNFIERGCKIKVFNAKTSFEEIAAWNPDGYFISNGPGDPGAMDYAIEVIEKMIESEKPLFGICLGHQLLSRTVGISTYKMKNGHRGLNHPVKNLITGKLEITSQNHGFAISPDDAFKNPLVEVTHINLNDKTIEGIRLKNKPVFSVQYHPEASPGPHDSHYLFDEFVNML